MKSPVIKRRSVTLAGRKTSVSMKHAFWRGGLREIAEGRDKSLYGLIGDIDAERKFANLSSAIRLFVLGFYRDQLDQQGEMVASPSGCTGANEMWSGVCQS
jgi:predicted DNA-binding ribbon-helix-helix protein